MPVISYRDSRDRLKIKPEDIRGTYASPSAGGTSPSAGGGASSAGASVGGAASASDIFV